MMCPSTRTARSGINIAELSVNTQGVNSTIVLQLISAECHTCALQNVSIIPAEKQNCSVIVDTRWPVRMAIITTNLADVIDESCKDLGAGFEENGNYVIYVKMKDKTITCQSPIRTGSDPADSNITIYVTIGIFAGLALACLGFSKSKRSFMKVLYQIHPNAVDTYAYTEQDLGTPTNGSKENGNRKVERLKSLDTFRGISLVIMMFVNYGGADYWFFSHSKWNGLTVADLVFPWFIWIMGTAMSYSYLSLARKNVQKGKIFTKILRRSVVLFALGFLVSSAGSRNFTKWRVMGVLQRFSLTYFITATVHMFVMKDSNVGATEKWRDVRDLVNYWKEWIVQLLLLFIHICITFFLKVPGCPTGYLGPGGLANDGNGEDVSLCTGGAARYVDYSILGDKLIYKSPTCAEIYQTTVPYDPEGFLGVLTSCFLCFLGLQAGKILVTFQGVQARVKRFLIWSVVLGSISAILCKASKNDGWIPINKNLWSISYILAMASMAFVLLTFCYLTVDVYKVWSGAPFYFPGMNSIVVYVCHEVFSTPFQTFWDIEPGSHAVAMLINVWDVSFWILLSFYLYHKKIFISV
ncbi:heparan-alpha-glucosaminide N-acetyltransferase-like [Mercenaria mercenaria]|uniref:heparan-alpha-glucosaminide N-acetyltransferase-like n=1 Tax=Mercenaria mercenaria TaxID=6596 RepID=UPI00234F890A|nr:heparan-alpha-glucosaminide N-acetyltransferase-like [Mercenaria mercenaria]